MKSVHCLSAILFSLFIGMCFSAFAGDDFADADTLVGASGSLEATNIGASAQPGEPEHFPGMPASKSIWFKWVAPTAEPIDIDTMGSWFPTLLAVYTGTQLSDLVQVGSNQQDPVFGGATSRVSFSPSAGETYYIAVDGVDGQEGNVKLNWGAAPVINTISGTVSLPSPDVAPAGGLSLEIWSWDTGGKGYFSSTSISIPAGAASASYTLNVIQDASVSYVVQYDCPACDQYVPKGYYNSVATSASYADVTTLAGGVNHNDADLTLLQGDTISGVVSLPGTDVAPPGGITVNLWLQETTSYWYYYQKRVVIAEGASQTNYSFTVPSDASYQWQLSYSCHQCSSYLRKGYYSTAGTTNKPSDLTLISGGADQPDIDLELLPGNSISGTLSLIAGDTAPAGNIAFSVYYVNDANEYTFGQYIAIPQGQTSAPYEVVVPPDPSNHWRIMYYCQTGCNSLDYVSEAYFGDSGSTWDPTVATALTGGMVHANKDFSFIRGDSITGKIELPGNDIAPAGGIWVSAVIQDYPTNKVYLENWVIVQEGESSADFKLIMPKEAGIQWKLQYRWYGNTPYLGRGDYNISGTQPHDNNSTPTYLQGGSNYSNLKLVLLKDLQDSCDLADELIAGPVAYNGDFYCSAENSIVAGGASDVTVADGSYVVYSARVVELRSGFLVKGGILRIGNGIHP